MYPMSSDSGLADLQRDWLAGSLRIKSFCAYEGKETFGIQIVDQRSASNLCTERLDPIAENHLDIVKPATKRAASYLAFKDAYLISADVAKNKNSPRVVEFDIDLGKSSFVRNTSPKFGDGPQVLSFLPDPSLTGVINNGFRAVFAVTLENPSDVDIIATSITYDTKEIGKVMGGSAGPLTANHKYFHKIKYVKGLQSLPLNPPYLIPAKSLGRFNLELATDAKEPGLVWYTQVNFHTSGGVATTKMFQIGLTGK
jgi:hypothetical protein